MERRLRVTRAALLVLALVLAPGSTEAQRLTYTAGQPLYPAYEGWERNPDGSYSMLFGYMNENWEQLIDVPVGPENYFSPGPADRGQPTHFLPRRNRFVFKVQVPADFGVENELIWTVRANGREFSAYGTLREDLFIDNVVIMSETGALGAGTSSPAIRANRPPEVQLEVPTEVRARVGEPLSLSAVVIDDGQPRRERRESVTQTDSSSANSSAGDEATAAERGDSAEPTPSEQLARALRLSTATSTVSKRVRLHFTWFVYRGPGEGAEFDPPQVKPWEDTRPFANSPWSVGWVAPEIPEDGRWVAEVTFSEPGTYVLRGRADDGGLYSDVEVTVHVERPRVFP